MLTLFIFALFIELLYGTNQKTNDTLYYGCLLNTRSRSALPYDRCSSTFIVCGDNDFGRLTSCPTPFVFDSITKRCRNASELAECGYRQPEKIIRRKPIAKTTNNNGHQVLRRKSSTKHRKQHHHHHRSSSSHSQNRQVASSSSSCKSLDSDPLAYYLNQTRQYVDTNGILYTEYRLYVQNNGLPTICHFSACVSPNNIVFTDLWNLDTVYDDEFDRLQSVFKLHLRSNAIYKADLTVREQDHDSLVVPIFKTADYRYCQRRRKHSAVYSSSHSSEEQQTSSKIYSSPTSDYHQYRGSDSDDDYSISRHHHQNIEYHRQPCSLPSRPGYPDRPHVPCRSSNKHRRKLTADKYHRSYSVERYVPHSNEISSNSKSDEYNEEQRPCPSRKSFRWCQFYGYSLSKFGRARTAAAPKLKSNQQYPINNVPIETGDGSIRSIYTSIGEIDQESTEDDRQQQFPINNHYHLFWLPERRPKPKNNRRPKIFLNNKYNNRERTNVEPRHHRLPPKPIGESFEHIDTTDDNHYSLFGPNSPIKPIDPTSELGVILPTPSQKHKSKSNDESKSDDKDDVDDQERVPNAFAIKAPRLLESTIATTEIMPVTECKDCKAKLNANKTEVKHNRIESYCNASQTTYPITYNVTQSSTWKQHRTNYTQWNIDIINSGNEDICYLQICINPILVDIPQDEIWVLNEVDNNNKKNRHYRLLETPYWIKFTPLQAHQIISAGFNARNITHIPTFFTIKAINCTLFRQNSNEQYNRNESFPRDKYYHRRHHHRNHNHSRDSSSSQSNEFDQNRHHSHHHRNRSENESNSSESNEIHGNLTELHHHNHTNHTTNRHNQTSSSSSSEDIDDAKKKHYRHHSHESVDSRDDSNYRHNRRNKHHHHKHHRHNHNNRSENALSDISSSEEVNNEKYKTRHRNSSYNLRYTLATTNRWTNDNGDEYSQLDITLINECDEAVCDATLVFEYGESNETKIENSWNLEELEDNYDIDQHRHHHRFRLLDDTRLPSNSRYVAGLIIIGRNPTMRIDQTKTCE